MLTQIREWILQRRQQAAINQFRKHSATFGHDLSHLSDDEVKQGVKKAAFAVTQFGMTIGDAGKVFRRMGLAAQEVSGL